MELARKPVFPYTDSVCSNCLHLSALYAQTSNSDSVIVAAHSPLGS